MKCTVKVGKCGSASFSDCGAYRYMLMRAWNEVPEKFVNWIMLNPSTATEDQNDPTISRCISFTKSWGYHGLYITNIFALRSTDPNALYSHAEPIGQKNDEHIIEWASRCAGRVVCAWGAHGSLRGRGEYVRNLLSEIPFYLKLNKDGSPAHPLYLSGKLKPQKWTVV